MHNIHITEGLVLRKRGVGEANTLLWLLTPKFGLIRAQARSTRVVQSKLRYGIEVLTMGRYALVQGKYEWRLTGAEAYRQVRPTAAIGRVSALLLRLVNGEEAHPDLYKTVIEGFDLLAPQKLPPSGEILFDSLATPTPPGGTFAAQQDAIETVLVLRILSHLGYLPETPALAQFVEGNISLELSAKALESRSLLIKTINESLSATGL